MSNRTYRMYGMVPYNLSPIQQGIQFGHAVQEYNNKIEEIREDQRRGLLLTKEEHKVLWSFKKWSLEDKTFIILNGGTTNNNPERLGSLNQHAEALRKLGVIFSTFYEPDLGDQLTAIVFLIDDRVFDRETWPNFGGVAYNDGTFDPEEFYEWKMKFSEDEKEAEIIVALRDYLPKLKLA